MQKEYRYIRCPIYIWLDELFRIRQLLPRFSEPRTPTRTSDIRRFGIVTPSKSTSGSRSKRDAITRQVDDDTDTAVPAQLNKHSITPTPRKIDKTRRILRTPPQSPPPEQAHFACNNSSLTEGPVIRTVMPSHKHPHS